MIRTAKIYRDRYGFSVIPLKLDKRPYIKWEEFQRRKATNEELDEWFDKYWRLNDGMIGIVTGKISGLAVVDFDDKDLVTKEFIDTSVVPIASTPRGYHFYFKYEDGITNTAHIGGKPIDVRGEGGYVVAPPSVTGEGKKYEWVKSLKTPMIKFPLEIFDQTEETSRVSTPRTKATFEQGTRDVDLFTIACDLVRGGGNEEQIRKTIAQLAKTCDPPFPYKEAMQKVDQALKRPGKKERRWADETRGWVDFTTGWFHRASAYGDLGARTANEKACIRMALHRLAESGIIEVHATKDGSYRLIQTDLEMIDWQSAPIEEVPMRFPLGIEEHVKIYPKSLIMIAGEKDAGKTGFLLEFARLNMNQHEIHFFMNETGDTELAVRLRMFQGMKTRDWDKVKFYRRDDNFEDVIKPDAINLVDYLDVTEGFANIGTPLKAIHSKLDTGIAIVAIQKNPRRYDFKKSEYIDVDLGIGGSKSIGKSRLYVAISPEEVKIVKAKCRRGKESPNGLVRNFRIYDGHDFVSMGHWRQK